MVSSNCSGFPLYLVIPFVPGWVSWECEITTLMNYEIIRGCLPCVHLPRQSPVKNGLLIWVGVRPYHLMKQQDLSGEDEREISEGLPWPPSSSFPLTMWRLSMCVCACVRVCMHAHSRWCFSLALLHKVDRMIPRLWVWKLVSWMSSGFIHLARPSVSSACRVWNRPRRPAPICLNFTSGQIPLPQIASWWKVLV